MSESIRRIEELFHAARRLPPSEQESFLAERCEGDASLIAEVHSLLECHAEAEGFLEDPLTNAMPHEPGPGPTAGTRVGPYRLVRVLAAGGMGTVYEAVQDHPRRSVAVKVLRFGLDSSDEVRRFEYESQILGRLRHPGIAHVYENGTFHDGVVERPYFAMEYIPGAVSVTEYARTGSLDVRSRIQLFAHICDAVHHGHQKGVIHRDLKPANILVDASGQPKIIDFGVARAAELDPELTTLRTAVGQLVGTLSYMSPEQGAADPDDVDTRSDVYSLGIVLYELLSGATPYDLRRKTIPESIRIVREEAPRRLSSHDPALAGDLETIVHKALEKDRDRRYPSAAAFAADLRRLLQQQPIEARPPSLAYHVRLFARRNKTLVGGASLLLLVLIGAVVVSTTFAVRSTRAARAEAAERAKAESMTELFQEIMFGARPEFARGRDITVREWIDIIGVRLDRELHDRPDALATIHHLIGETLDVLDDRAAARLHLVSALEIRRSRLGDAHVDTRDTLNALARVCVADAQFDEAERYVEVALDRRGPTSDDDDPVTLTSRKTLGIVRWRQGASHEARALLEDVISVLRRRTGYSDTQDLVDASNMLASVLMELDRHAEAEEILRASMKTCDRLFPDDHPMRQNVIQRLSFCMQEQARYDEARELQYEVLETRRRILGENHRNTLDSAHNLAMLLQRCGRIRDAEALLEDLIERRKTVLGEHHPSTLTSMSNLGVLLTSVGRFEEAYELFEHGATLARSRLDDDEPAVRSLLAGLAMAERNLGRLDASSEHYRMVLDSQLRVLGPMHSSTLETIRNMAIVAMTRGDIEGAARELDETLTAQRKLFGPDLPAALVTQVNLACAYHKLGRFVEALSCMDDVMPRAVRTFGTDHMNTYLFRVYRGRCLHGMGRIEEAEEELLTGIDGLRRATGEDSFPTQRSYEHLARLYDDQGRFGDAAAIRAKITTPITALAEVP